MAVKADMGRWPQGKTWAGMISVNLDGEFFSRIYYPEIDVDSVPEFALMGGHGIKNGLPRMLDLLEAHKLRATFFIPGQIAVRYPQAVREIASRGHEIGCHGNWHENLGTLSEQEQRAALKEATDLLTQAADKAPVGFRAPEGELTPQTLSILKELGYTYSSSLSDDDRPYLHPCGLAELPINWAMYDLPYFIFNFDPPIPQGQARIACAEKVLDNWMLELEGARRWGTLLVPQLDPQAVGEQGRMFMLEQLLEAMERPEDGWLATGEQIASHVLGLANAQ